MVVGIQEHPQPACLPIKEQACVLFISNLTYATYRNLDSLDQLHLRLFEHLYLAVECVGDAWGCTRTP